MIYDLIVLGAGPAGAESARVSAKQGWSVLLIEKENLGGTCSNRGCMPTKAYYVDLIEHCAPAEDIWKKKEGLLPTLRKGIGMWMEKAGVTVVKGTGTIIDVAGELKALEVTTAEGTTQVSGKKLMIATGAHSIGLECEISQLPPTAVIVAVTTPSMIRKCGIRNVINP